MFCANGHLLTDDTLYVNPRGDRVCRTCRKEAAARFYDRNRDRVLEQMREDYAANPEPRKASQRSRYANDPIKYAEISSRWTRENPEAAAEARRQRNMRRRARQLDQFIED